MPVLTEAFEARETIAFGTKADKRARFASAASWGAIIAGAAAAAAMSLILLILGTGLGLSVVSPWVQDGIGAASLTVASIAWIGFASLVASGVGGYLAGRLRTRWLAVDPAEVHFRDTAHGFLAWAVATLLTATLLSTAVAGMVGSDVTTVAAKALTLDAMPAEDLRHGAQLIARHTGLTEQAAAARLSAADANIRSALLQAETAARETADVARKASAKAALWLFVTLLGGAFVASVSATIGGRQRDQS